MDLNPDRRSRQVRSSRPRAIARAARRKKYVRNGNAACSPHPLWHLRRWVGNTLWTADVFDKILSARFASVEQARRDLLHYRAEVNARCSALMLESPGVFKTPRVAGGRPYTSEEAAKEQALMQRHTEAQQHFERWAAGVTPPLHTNPLRTPARSLIG